MTDAIDDQCKAYEDAGKALQDRVLLKYLYTDRDFDRVHYKAKHPKGYTRYYCLMEHHNMEHKIELYRCSVNGEPSHIVTIINSEFESPPDEYSKELLKRYLQ